MVTRHRAPALVDDLAGKRVHARDVLPVLLRVSHHVLGAAELMSTRTALLGHFPLVFLSEDVEFVQNKQESRGDVSVP